MKDARKAALLEAARRAPVRTWRSTTGRDLGAAMGTVAVMVMIFLAVGGVRPHDRPVPLMAATAAGAAAWAALTVWLVFGRGRSMLGRPAWMIVVVTAAVPIVLLAWKTGLSAAFDGMREPWPARPGLRCLLLGMAAGVPSLLTLVWLRRGELPSQPRLRGAALGVAAGACAWVLIDLWCPVAWTPHLLLGHVLPVALLGLAGALAGGLLRPRSRQG